jgi:chromosome segregation ATPase
MARLEQAAERFRAALAALDKAALPLLEARKSAREAQSRVEALDAERQQLIARVARLEEDARALSGLTEEVEGRLDGAIAEIRSALGR